MTTVVIGAGGYTAFNLVKKLSKTQEILAVLSDKHRQGKPGKFYRENNIKTLSSIELLLSENLNQESKIIYLGGYGVSDHNFPDVESLTKAYITGVVQSLEVARKFECEILIGGSYWELIKNVNTNTNINLYASFQAAQNMILEYFVLQYKISIKKVFLADSYGIDDWRPKLLQAIIISLETGIDINMGSPAQIIAPIYINDVIEDLIDIMNLKISNLESVTYLQLIPEKIYTLGEFINLIELITKKTVPVKWNTIKKTRLDIETFPVSKNIYDSKIPRTSLIEGLNYVLNTKN